MKELKPQLISGEENTNVYRSKKMLSEWYDLSSSWAKATRVDRELDFTDIQFKSGVICRYSGAYHYDNIISSGSPGTYVNTELKGYDYTVVTE